MSIEKTKYLPLYPSNFDCYHHLTKFLLYEDRIEIRDERDDHLFLSLNSQEINNITPDFLKLNVSEFYDFITSEVEKRNYDVHRVNKGYDFIFKIVIHYGQKKMSKEIKLFLKN